MQFDKKVCIVGLGYIGLPSAALLANRGYNVHGVDINDEVVNTINKGKIHIIEPELDIFVHSAVKSGKLVADVKPVKSDIFIIAVPTPFYMGHKPNLEYVISATRSIAPYLEDGNLVILESTSPIKTTEKVEETLRENKVDTDNIYIAHCPERVLPGHIMKELVENDRIIGGLTTEAAEKVKEFYSTFVEGEIFITDSRTAELAKLVENSYRDVNIAFANELSILCDNYDINVWDLIQLANRHPRVNIMNPGCGVGGHCIAVDPWFIVDSGEGNAILIETARRRNDYKSEWTYEKIKNEILLYEKKKKEKPAVAFMGISYKSDIDDLRESPAYSIVKRFISDDFKTIVVEPNLDNHNEFKLTDYLEAVKVSDIIVFLVAHKEFKTLKISNKIVLDFCGVLQP